MTKGWDRPLRLQELAHGPVRRELAPDAAERAAVADRLGLLALPALTAEVVVRPWMDGVEVEGDFQAVVEQQCGVTLEPFEQPLAGRLQLRAVPAGSPHAATPAGGEVVLDPQAPDPPDVLEGETLNLADLVVEHLALALDPFPRKPGAAFVFDDPAPQTSPFAALARLKPPGR